MFPLFDPVSPVNPVILSVKAGRKTSGKRRVDGLVAALCLLGFWTGCGEAPTDKSPQTGVITFAAHIAPIIYENCTPCHRPGSAGPFSLISYDDAAKRKKMIREVTRSRYMPPWPADPDYRHFLGERVLSQEEIDLIGAWVAQGAPLGDSSRIPPPPVFPTGSQLGAPDLVLTMEEAFAIRGDNRDRFLFGKIPYEIARDTFIRAIEFVPGNTQLVHHMNGHLISYEFEKKADVFAGERILDRETVPTDVAWPRLGLLNDDGTYPALTPLVCSYLPGISPAVYPEGIGGYTLKRKGAFLFSDLHYGPSAKDTFDQSRFNIFFSDKPPRRPTREIQMGTLGISDIVPPLLIPPDTVMTFRTRAVIQNDISLLTLNPHMHLLGKTFLAYAVPPQGDTIPLIHIPQWDFRWQYNYTFPTLLRLPKGSLVEVVATFDNTRENPVNPFDPPQTVTGRNASMKTTDEMLQFIFTYLPYEPGDEAVSLAGEL